ncbi:MAG: PDZ domain-containing protein [Candidatus Kuenenia sp.]|nr:PDZ domain-containing protein [Candidatus Kuenenia hertensis]
MKIAKSFFINLTVTLFLFLSSTSAFANQNTNIETLRQELIELEKYTKPLIEIFRKVSELVSPSVVSLITEKKPYGDQPSPQTTIPDQNPHANAIPKKGLGSGIIVDEGGYILTNNHVISDFSPEEITVATYNDEHYSDIKIIGVDPNTDLAIIKIDGSGFVPAKFGNPDEVQVGDWVIAIGNPFGFQQTVSMGIISAKGRTHVIPFALPFLYEDFFQTDAAINPGNSGGPLVNLRGEVIGVNTAIATRSGGFQGVGFALSASIAQETVETLINTGTIVRGYLGIGTQDITDEFAMMLGFENKHDIVKYFELNRENGVFVMEVWSDTPASKAGILPGDVIFEMDSKVIKNSLDLQRVIRHAKIDARIVIKVIRNGVENTLVATVEQQPESLSGKTYTAFRKQEEPAKFSIGLVVNDLSYEIAKSLGLENENGVLVIEVDDNSPAGHAGIKPGDLITKVGTKNVNSVIEFMGIIEEYLSSNKTITVYVKNKGFITLK